jgi:uncharacterized caspase-like protein
VKSKLIFLLFVAIVGFLSGEPRSIAQTDQSNRQLTQDSSQPTQTSRRRLALVIGNGAYEHSGRLANPPNDATLVAATLRQLGFEVKNGSNLTQREMKQRIREFGQSLRANGGVGLFYFAGHGVQAKGHNYLVPIDADIQTEADLEDVGVDLNYVLNLMDDAQSALNIVILDACRNNPFGRSFRSAQDGLAQVKAPTGTLIAYATAPDSIAADGMGTNSPYTQELVQQMQGSGVLVETVFRRVTERVSSRTNGKQEPWFSANVKGDFYFTGNSAGANSANTSNSASIDPAAIELSYWESIKTSTNPEDFKSYLDKYPDGHFAALAKSRLQAAISTKPTSGDANPLEMTYWNEIKNSENANDFRTYVTKFPTGLFVDLANSRVAALEAKAREAAKLTETASAAKRVTLYFYRTSQTVGGGWNPNVSCDNKELARMDNGRYFGASLEPGKHVCRAGDKEGAVEIDLKAGEEYYIKVSIRYFFTGHASLGLVAKEKALIDLKEVKLLGADKVRDRTLVPIFQAGDKKQ